MSSDEDVILSLNGSFKLTVAGREIAIGSNRNSAILAVLATAPQQKCSRDRLRQMFWPRSPPLQGAGSLRTALSALRRDLGPDAWIIGSNRSSLWFARSIELRAPAGGTVFFADAPGKIGTEFDCWLDVQRQKAAIHPAKAVAAGRLPVPQRTGIAIAPPKVFADDPHSHLLAERALNDIIAHLSAYEVVELIDLRDVSRDLFAERGNKAAAHPWLMIEVTLTKAGRDALLTAKLIEVAQRRLYWSHAETVDCRDGALPSLEKLTELANHVVDAALMAVLRCKEGAIPNGASAPQSMIGVLHQLFSMSRDGQRSVRSYLSSHEGLSHSALANACYALSIANTLGEDGHRTADLRAARERARIAVTLDPQNALVLAMTGHVFGFALREFETGEELTGLACKLAPSLPQAWDFAAMNAIYRGQVEKACEFSQRAAKLGYFSAYRPLYLSSMAISATLAGNHKAAVDLSQSVLSRLPGFLGVMRHSVVSLSALDRGQDAQEMIAQIRELDPRFSREEIRDPRYPIPSEASRELIGEALSGLRSTR